MHIVRVVAYQPPKVPERAGSELLEKDGEGTLVARLASQHQQVET